MVLTAIVNNLKAHSSKKNPAAPCKKLPQFIFFFTFLPFYLFTFKIYSSGSVFKLITLPVTGLRTM